MFTSLVAVSLLATLSIASPFQIPIEEYTKTLASPAVFPSAAKTALIAALQTAVTEEARLNILLPDPSKPDNVTFQFVNNTVLDHNGGTIGLATVSNFPALLGTNLGQAVGFVNPCGLNVPHEHPRSNEFLTVVEGYLIGGFVTENNPGGYGPVVGSTADPKTFQGPLPIVTTHLNKYKGTLFPQGAIHWQFNPTCEPAVFVAGFDSNDPGRVQIATSFFSITYDKIIETALGPVEVITPDNIDAIRKHVPASFAEVVDSCARKCGLNVKSEQETPLGLAGVPLGVDISEL